MRASVSFGIGLGVLLISSAFAQALMCPIAKEPGCTEVNPSPPASCPADFCNVAAFQKDGGKVCLWRCAAHFNDLTVNGVPVDSMINAYKENSR